MLSLRCKSPVDYRLCTQTVTVYHKNGDTYTRAVYDRAFLDFKKTQSVDKVGVHESNSFLLVIPCQEQVVFPKDKVYLGTGPEIATREAWAEFIPTKVQGLVVVEYVDPKYWNGQMVHVEAGG